jgi:hypothetical protein
MNNAGADIACIIAQLPAVSTPKELPAGDFNICSLPASLLAGGKIKNVLLGQTITLGLNLGITNPSPLSGFPLQAGVLATQDLVGDCGSNTAEIRECVYNPLDPFNLIDVINEYTYGTIHANVIAAIVGAPTVNGLYNLANDALADTDGVVGSENGATLGQITEALNTINRGFDKCKQFIGWDVAPCPPTNPSPRIAGTVINATEELKVAAYPNPYEENFSLKVNSPVSGEAQIGFYTIDGIKIGEMKRDVVANTDAWIPFKVPAVYRTRIVYTVAVGTYYTRGIVLSPN